MKTLSSKHDQSKYFTFQLKLFLSLNKKNNSKEFACCWLLACNNYSFLLSVGITDNEYYTTKEKTNINNFLDYQKCNIYLNNSSTALVQLIIKQVF